MSNPTTRALRVALLLTVAASTAHAQLRLQTLPLPALPLQGLSQSVAQLDSGAGLRLSEVRRLEIDRLVRENRHLLELDPKGNPIVRGEIVADTPDEAAVVRAEALGFSVAREQNIEALGLRIVVLRAPDGLSTKKALARLRAADPSGVYDFNHLYSKSDAASLRTEHANGPRSAAEFHPPRSMARIGLVDTGVDSNHPAFSGASIEAWGCDGRFVPAAHGTAVASLLVGNADRFHGVQPDAELFAADVYCDRPSGGAVDVLAAAFGWLIEKRVAVVNVSLVGPHNALLERAVAALVAHGIAVVAAVGNDGPAAAPLYPASYPQVVGVTGVDGHRHVLLEAARGPQVMFAAPGADLAAASGADEYVAVRGTSFAAPIVAGLLSATLERLHSPAAIAAIDTLVGEAIDLGPAGRDETYGFGLVGTEYRIDPALLADRRK